MVNEKEMHEVASDLLKHSEGIEFGEVAVRLIIHNGRVTVTEYTATHKERNRSSYA